MDNQITFNVIEGILEYREGELSFKFMILNNNIEFDSVSIDILKSLNFPRSGCRVSELGGGEMS